MAKLYTAKQRQDILKSLEIKPLDGKVNGREAAQILTWRAKEEQDIEHIYTDATLRRHVKQGNIKPERINPENTRFNLYPIEQVFELPLVPKRGIAQKRVSKKPKNTSDIVLTS